MAYQRNDKLMTRAEARAKLNIENKNLKKQKKKSFRYYPKQTIYGFPSEKAATHGFRFDTGDRMNDRHENFLERHHEGMLDFERRIHEKEKFNRTQDRLDAESSDRRSANEKLLNSKLANDEIERQHKRFINKQIEDGVYYYDPKGQLIYDPDRASEMRKKENESDVRNQTINKNAKKRFDRHMKSPAKKWKYMLWLDDKRDEYYKDILEQETEKYDKRKKRSQTKT